MRVKNWNGKLIDWASNQIGKKLNYGEIDCVMICRKGIEVIYGKDIFADVGTWHNKTLALKAYSKAKPLSNYLLNNGWSPVEKNYLQNGDIVILETEPLQTATLVINNEILVIDPEKGVQRQDLRMVKHDYFCFKLR